MKEITIIVLLISAMLFTANASKTAQIDAITIGKVVTFLDEHNRYRAIIDKNLK